MSRLATVHLFELRFGKFGHLKNGFHSCLVQSDPHESVNLQSIKNTIQNMVFSRYAQYSGHVTSWHLRDNNFQVFQELLFIFKKCFKIKKVSH